MICIYLLYKLINFWLVCQIVPLLFGSQDTKGTLLNYAAFVCAKGREYSFAISIKIFGAKVCTFECAHGGTYIQIYSSGYLQQQKLYNHFGHK